MMMKILSFERDRTMYINIDFAELHKFLTMLDNSCSRDRHWEQFNPSSSDIDILFANNYCEGFYEHFYDSEADYDDEEFLMYMDYCCTHKTDESVTGRGFYEAMLACSGEEECDRYSKNKHTHSEYRQAYNKVRKQMREFNSKRIRFNNWVEINEKGNFKATQQEVDSLAKAVMYEVKKSSVHKRNRFWIIRKEDGSVLIYYYGRDYMEVDYVWVFKRSE